MITITESKTLMKHKSCECKCKFGSRKCNSNQKQNNDKCWSECKNLRKHVFENIYVLNHRTGTCENFKYLGSITGDSVIMCDEIIEATKTVPTNSNGKKVTCNVENFYILLTFLLINISLLIIIILIVFTVTS